ncbi:MAG: phosphoglycerate kinase [Candidatus Altiarchaeota archaeon]
MVVSSKKPEVFKVRPSDLGGIFIAEKVQPRELEDIAGKTTLVTELPIGTTTRKDVDFLGIIPPSKEGDYPKMVELARREWKSIDDVDLRGKVVFMRAELNVPMKKGVISDYSRLETVVETIKTCLERGVEKIYVVGHLGKADGEVVDESRFDPVAKAMQERLGVKVDKLNDCVGPEVERQFRESKAKVVLGENVRFHGGEQTKDERLRTEFAKQLARIVGWREGEKNENLVFVNAGFGLVHRAHASNVGVPLLLPEAVMDRTVEREVKFLLEGVKNPERPLTILLSGIKDEKVKALNSPLVRGADHIVVGSGLVPMLFMPKDDALKVKGLEFQELETWDIAQKMRGELGGKLIVPQDIVVINDASGERRVVDLELDSNGFTNGSLIPEGFRIADVGPKSRKPMKDAVLHSKSLVWFGPLGDPRVANETNQAIVDAAREGNVPIIVGGGDTGEVVNKLKASNVVFLSTGGGASLHVLQFGDAPGLKIQTPVIKGGQVAEFFKQITE